MNRQTILVVEDEGNILTIMRAILSANDYKVIEARDGKQALQMVASHCPDLVLLDLGLPDMDGLDIIRQVRAWSKMPIVVVSARDRERDKVEALDLGADDYITKPFGTSELLARIRAALRHMQGENAQACDRFVCGGLTIDFFKRRIYVDGEEAHLTQNEYKIVTLLAKYAGRVLTYDFIIQHVWGPHAQRDNQILRVNMANIRRKLEKNPASPAYISTEIGVGYRMAEADGPRL
ncbi:MAG TPA: response regulator transcription factor [Candidatus Excrementavichristensenella intestinipullorum]|nr:response regulator transcription factor [Candidatus Excrementavichristensenella intestinipullorum]